MSDVGFNRYISMRITMPHDQWPLMKPAFDRYEYGYVVYPHCGTKTNKEHFHAFIPWDGPVKEMDSLRLRMKRIFPDAKGNGFLSMKMMENPMVEAVTYGSKEKTTPWVRGDACALLVELAPQWVPKEKVQSMIPVESSGNKKPRVDSDWQLTYANFVEVAVRHAREHPSMVGRGLKAVIQDVIKQTRWRPSKYMLTGGVPSFYEEDYQRRSGQRTTDPDMDWWTPRTI